MAKDQQKGKKLTSKKPKKKAAKVPVVKQANLSELGIGRGTYIAGVRFLEETGKDPNRAAEMLRQIYYQTFGPSNQPET